MHKFRLILAAALTGILVALTYHVFEIAVHGSIDLIWYEWLNTDVYRWLVVPACLVITLAYFWVQHVLDPSSENRQDKGLGENLPPTFLGYVKVLFIGFFSLVAGASLGPEAVLVPACMIAGGLVATKLFDPESRAVKVITAAGFIALFTAFFHSIIIGILSVLIVTKQIHVKLTAPLAAIAIVAAVSSYGTLKLLPSEPYATLPSYSWNINATTLIWSTVLAFAGLVSIYFMNGLHVGFEKLRRLTKHTQWWFKGAVAATGLSALYLLGGPLVEFTGNKSIIPLLDQAAGLGVLGLTWIFVIKLAAIGWSKSMGYRGGMIFPTIFVAAVLVAIVQLYVHDFNFIYGIIAVLIGAFIANNKVKILF